ncbi:MAG TPA: hypothetical protein VK821_20840 [Dehalococcoidia bacterium]|nr:hypothetical protein [Dehalococcoidia bacterium]
MNIISENGRESITTQLGQIAYLRATGPNPFDYWVWADYTAAIVNQACGAGSQEDVRFRQAISQPGRTEDQRGIADNMTLGLHGEWGIWARLDRAQQVLEEIGGAEPQAS